MNKKTRMASIVRSAMFATAAAAIGVAAAAPASASDWETRYALTVGPLHRYTVGAVARGDRSHGGIVLPRSSYYSHTFLRAEVGLNRTNHGYEEPAFLGYVFNLHGNGIPHLAGDFEHDIPTGGPVRSSPPPETDVRNWELY